MTPPEWQAVAGDVHAARTWPATGRQWSALPYCVQRDANGRPVVVDRNYKQIADIALHHYERLRTLSIVDDFRDRGAYLYNDETAPWRSRAMYRSYAKRVAVLIALVSDALVATIRADGRVT